MQRARQEQRNRFAMSLRCPRRLENLARRLAGWDDELPHGANGVGVGHITPARLDCTDLARLHLALHVPCAHAGGARDVAGRKHLELCQSYSRHR